MGDPSQPLSEEEMGQLPEGTYTGVFKCVTQTARGGLFGFIKCDHEGSEHCDKDLYVHESVYVTLRPPVQAGERCTFKVRLLAPRAGKNDPKEGKPTTFHLKRCYAPTAEAYMAQSMM